jgi:fumarate hydratase class II
MPGKVNPVMSEMVIQVGAQVIGNDAVITFASTCGAFELNTMLPVAAYNLLQAIELLTTATRTFTRRCIAGLEADAAKCESNLEKSLAMCTALVPAIGYEKAAKIAKLAYETNRTVREVAMETSGLDKATLDKLLDPRRQTGNKTSNIQPPTSR